MNPQTMKTTEDPAQILAKMLGADTALQPYAMAAVLNRYSDAARVKRDAFDALPKRAPRDNASPKALAVRAAKEAYYMAAKRAYDEAKEAQRAATLAYGRAALGSTLAPYIRAAVEALPVQGWVRVGSGSLRHTLRGLLHLDVEGGVVTFDLLATFDKMGLLEDVAVHRFTETGMERERAATMDPMAYLASKRHPSSWDLLWHLRSGDRLSDDFRKWSMDSRAGFGFTPIDAQAFARMGEKMSALLGTLQALQMPNIALLEMATDDLVEIYTGTVPDRDYEFIKRLVQAFPAAREIHNDAVRGVMPRGHTNGEM